MNTLSDEQLKELEALYQKATPGEWRLCDPQEHPWRIGPIEPQRQDTVTIVNDSGYGIMCFPTEIGSGHTRDLELSIALHNAFPSLIHAAEVAQQFQWREIESAPRDGARFLATKRWRNGEWQYFECCYVETIAGPKWHDLSSNDWSKPTHWMPLPQPPTKGGES